jgi:hypothetical protein
MVMLFLSRARSKPKLFSASLGELTKDLDHLSDQPPGKP